MEGWGPHKAGKGPGADSTYWLCDLGKQLNLSEPHSLINYCLSVNCYNKTPTDRMAYTNNIHFS